MWISFHASPAHLLLQVHHEPVEPNSVSSVQFRFGPATGCNVSGSRFGTWAWQENQGSDQFEPNFLRG